MVNIDGTNLREISTGGSPGKSSWSPDGKRLAVIESRAETSSEPKSDLVVISLDGSPKQIVVENQVLYWQMDMNWSPVADWRFAALGYFRGPSQHSAFRLMPIGSVR